LAALDALRMDTAPSSGVGHGDGALIVCDRLVRIYSAEGIEVQALQGLDLVIAPGELTALVGCGHHGGRPDRSHRIPSPPERLTSQYGHRSRALTQMEQRRRR
jgi:hypothetical protein